MHHRHNLESCAFPSERITKNCLEERCIIGIGEAGRGPVLGPLVYSLFISPESQINWLSQNGAIDSKQLTAKAREGFFKKLSRDNDTLGWKVNILHPEHISNCMLRKDKLNLNELSYSAVFGLINSVQEAGVRISMAFVDTLGKEEKYEASLGRKFPNIKFTVRSKADILFPIVGAASIVAKVIRDDVLSAQGIEASGYPGDQATVEWLENNVEPVFGFPSVVRFSWRTCAKILEIKCYSVKWLDEEDDKENRKRQSATADIATPCTGSPLGLHNCLW